MTIYTAKFVVFLDGYWYVENIIRFHFCAISCATKLIPNEENKNEIKLPIICKLIKVFYFPKVSACVENYI